MDLVRPSDAALRTATGVSDHQRELLDEWLLGAGVRNSDALEVK